MRRVSEVNRRLFQCQNGEQVTFHFAVQNTALRITFRLSNEVNPRVVQGDTLTLQVNQELMELRLFFHFINESGTGGAYDIALSDNNGGNFTDDPSVLQAGDLVPVRTYTFFI